MQFETNALTDAVKEFIGIMKDSGLSYMYVKNDKFELELGQKNSPPAPPMMPAMPPMAAAPAAAPVASAPEQPAVQAEEPQQEYPYTIVLASAVSKKNAQIFVDNLIASGEDTAEVYVSGKMRRVIVGKFSTEKEAYEYISAKKKTNGSFSQAWILKL